MRLRAALALAVLIFFAAACGGDDDGPEPTSAEVTIGPAASLPRGVKSVNPPHAASVEAASLQAGGQTGVCVTLDLLAGDGIEDFQGVTALTLNVEDVSDSLVWTNTDDNPTSEATGCYMPPAPLDPGNHAATVRYNDSTGRAFIYNWQFTVTNYSRAARQTLLSRR